MAAAMASSPAPGACGWEAALGDFFTEAELAAADLLVQLSGGGGGGGDEPASPSPSSPRSVNTAWEDGEMASAATAGAGAGAGAELDRRASKRYRLLSDLYAATGPVMDAAAAAAASARKRKRDNDPQPAMTTRYGDQCF